MWLLATPGGGQALTPFRLVVTDYKKGECKGEGLMHVKTEIPFDRSGEPSRGASIIKIVAYGNTPKQAMELHIQMRNENCMRGTPVPDELGSRFTVTWREDTRKLADVIPFTGRWNRRPQKKG